ncbi:MAG: hypothetical protein EBS69_10125 [Verrucomicrobia bacterium]|nr:hypothetical protein [Verrucomicrobiota bacterium]
MRIDRSSLAFQNFLHLAGIKHLLFSRSQIPFFMGILLHDCLPHPRQSPLIHRQGALLSLKFWTRPGDPVGRIPLLDRLSHLHPILFLKGGFMMGVIIPMGNSVP